jgi:integrase
MSHTVSASNVKNHVSKVAERLLEIRGVFMANKKANELSDKQLQKLIRPDAKQYIRDGNGLSLCITPTERPDWRQWYFIYTSPETSKRRYYPLGTYPGVSLANARVEATKLLAEVKRAVDPLERERREMEERLAIDEQRRQDEAEAAKVTTVEDLCSDYITKHAKVKKRSWAKDERILNVDVIPAWNGRKAQDIAKGDIISLLDKVVGRGSPIMANNTFAVIRKMFNWAVEKDILKTSPCLGVKMPSERVSRDRVLSEIEVKTLWGNLGACAISPEIRNALKLILLTAQRPGEVIGMHTKEIDVTWWTIPAERAKNKKTHRVFLTEMALELINQSIERVRLIREIPPEEEYSGYIFPTPHRSKEQSIDPLAVAIAVGRNLAFPLTDDKGSQLYTKEGKPATENRTGIQKWTSHDLRRSAATFMAQFGEMDEVIDAVLNHAKQGVIKVYNQYRYDDEKQAAMVELEYKITCIINGEEYRTPKQRRADKELKEAKQGNVVNIETARQAKAA